MASSSAAALRETSADGPLILRTAADIRAWRSRVRQRGISGQGDDGSLPTIGFVPTMGALHAGHLSLVQASLDENDYTVVSIFVNPAQFAPHEDLDVYPRTLESDLAKLQTLSSSSDQAGTGRRRERKVDIVFAPTVSEMYPNGFTQRVEDQVGAFVEIRGLADEMEGRSRPGFFRGVATVVTKLFHVVQPDHAYFGQKDIQQAIILRRLLSDLLFAYPPSPSHLKVLLTGRDPKDGLALSSRNAYLTPKAREVAPVLYRALREAERVFYQLVRSPNGGPADASDATSDKPIGTSHPEPQKAISQILDAARSLVATEAAKLDSAAGAGANLPDSERVYLKMNYITLNDPITLADLERESQGDSAGSRGRPGVDLSRGAILSGALVVQQGKQGRPTRLIDNILLGFSL